MSATILSAALLLASCQKEEPARNQDENKDDNKQEQVGETLTVSISAEGEWTSADVLGLSIPSTEELNKAASYENGKFTAEIATPKKDDIIYSYYPYSPTTADGKFTVNLPSAVAGNASVVKAKVGSPVSLGEITDPLAMTISMKDILGAIKFNLSDISEGGQLNGHEVVSVSIVSENDLAGVVVVEIMNGNTTLSEGSKTLVITPSEGTALGNEAVTLTISALPGTYTGTVLVTTSASEYEFELNTTVTAGQTAQVNLECEGVAEYKPIETEEEWNSFIEAVIAGSYSRFVNPETGAVELGANLTFEDTPKFPATTENTSLEFNGVFDGKGFEITCSTFTRPLFNFLSTEAVVKNLTVRGAYSEMMNSGLCGNAVIAKVNKGTIENVTTYVNTELTLTTGVIFGTICGQNGGTLKNCKNYGNITLTYAAETNSGFYGGGLAAIGHTVSGDPAPTALNVDATCTPGQFINCENHGNISLTATNGKPVRQGFGGICGLVYFNGVKFEKCTNTGNISRVSNGELSNSFSASIGGILGRSAGWYTQGTGDSGAMDNGYDGTGGTLGNVTTGFATDYINCSNSGDIFCECRHSGGVIANQHTRRSDNVGGITGLAIGKEGSIQNFTGCSNTGNLSGGWATTVNTLVLGGIVGYANYSEISGCSSICEIKSTDSSKPIGAAGGLVGYAIKGVAVKDNCVSVPAMDVYGKPESTNFLYGLVIGNIFKDATVTSVQVGGSIKADGNDLAITAENYTQYLVSAASGASLNSPTATWYTAQ